MPGLDAEIIEVGEGVDGPLYVLREYVYAETASEIIDYFESKYTLME